MRETENMHKENTRFQHELKEMQNEQDLDKIDDDVEAVATLMEWKALEYEDQPKTAKWFMWLAIIITVCIALFVWVANFMAAISIAILGISLYILVQKESKISRYRIMVDGVAINNTLYHYRDLDKFNVIYEPGETKTVLIKSKKKLTPLINLEIGEADPVAIRDLLLDFVEEDQDMNEPLVDIWARRLGI